MYIQLIPTTLDDIRLDGKWRETVTEDKFLLFDDSEQTHRMIALATSDNFTDLSTADIFYCDGTFYTCPTMFHQTHICTVLTS